MAQNNFLKDNQNLIIWGVVLYIGYNKIVKPLLEKTGIKKSDEEENVDAEIIKIESAFNPNYWKQFSNPKILTAADAKRKTEIIYNSVGWAYDDFEKVLGVFKTLKYKTQVSYLSAKFYEFYKKDLITWLLGDIWPSDRYSAEQVNTIIQLVNKYRANG